MSKKREGIIEKAVKEKKLYLDVLRSKAPKSLYLFNKYIMGVEKGKNKVPLAPFHKELCNFVQDDADKKKLVLIPRMHLKSTLVTVGYTLWRIVKDSDTRVLILSGKHENAVDFVSAIKDHLQKNETLKEVFGEVAADPVEWRTGRFTLSTNRTSVGEKEPTVLGAGLTSNVVSKHFDVIILDDIVTRENTETIEQIEKVIKRYRDVIDLMETNAQLIVIGTRWTDNDLYSWLLDKDNHQISQFKTMIRSAMEWDGPIENALKTGEGFKNSIWPDKFDRKELLKRYKAKGPYEFSTQYLNDPVPDTDATFQKDWIQYYEEADIRGLALNTYVTIDPALTTKKESDYTAMVVTSIDRWGNIYIRDVLRGRFLPSQIIELIFKVAERWHPNRIGLEDVAWQKTLSYEMREEMKERKRRLPVYPLKPGNRNKEERIKGLQPLYANGKVFHNSSLPTDRYLVDELLRFPRGRHDDIIDALAYVLDFLSKPKEGYSTELQRGRYLY